jgi:hypothetical protein
MAGRIEIINIALARLGESPIQALDEGTVAASTAKLLYTQARQETLREYTWAFALKQATLARYESTPADFSYAFALPTDCLRVVRILSGQDYVVRGDQLCTNSPSVTLEYISDVDDETRFDSSFVKALSFKLASDLAIPIKGSAQLMASYANAFADHIRTAATVSAGERGRELPSNPYVDARTGYLYGDD